MSLFHGRWRRRTSLLAAGALDEPESRAARLHVVGCVECAAALAAACEALALASGDGVRAAALPVPLGALVTRVQARLDQERARAPRRRPVLVGATVLAALAVVLLSRVVLDEARTGGPSPITSATPVRGRPSSPREGSGTVPPDALARLENTLERERTARYLGDAQDLLVTVAASPQRCVRRRDAVEVGPEAERSRELLARRRLFVETDAAATVVARDVLDDVEEMLREVAALDPCARPRDLEAIRGEIARRHLLMKIDLVTRELQG